LRQQLTETTEPNAGPISANVNRQRRSGQAPGDLELAAPVPAARNMKINCCHHWVIEVAAESLSKGVCRLCGEERLFRNQLQWAEIVPARVVVNRGRQASDSLNAPEQMGEYAPLLAQSRYGRPAALQSAERGY
jgi:hypothetical protein